MLNHRVRLDQFATFLSSEAFLLDPLKAWKQLFSKSNWIRRRILSNDKNYFNRLISELPTTFLSRFRSFASSVNHSDAQSLAARSLAISLQIFYRLYTIGSYRMVHKPENGSSMRFGPKSTKKKNFFDQFWEANSFYWSLINVYALAFFASGSDFFVLKLIQTIDRYKFLIKFATAELVKRLHCPKRFLRKVAQFEWRSHMKVTAKKLGIRFKT